MRFNSFIPAIASILAATAVAAEEPVSSSAPSTPPPADAVPQKPAEKDPQAAVNQTLEKSAGADSGCYRGFHTSYDYDITGSALTALGRKVIEPGGLCDQYRKYSADMPIEIGVPLLPGVSVNIDKLCKMVQRPPCPEPTGEPSKSPDQASK